MRVSADTLYGSWVGLGGGLVLIGGFSGASVGPRVGWPHHHQQTPPTTNTSMLSDARERQNLVWWMGGRGAGCTGNSNYYYYACYPTMCSVVLINDYNNRK